MQFKIYAKFDEKRHIVEYWVKKITGKFREKEFQAYSKSPF
jgi:hypothetical protein